MPKVNRLIGKHLFPGVGSNIWFAEGKEKENCNLQQTLRAHVKGVDEYSEVAPLGAKLQNTQPLISISLNKNSNYCYNPRSSNHTNTCK